MAKDKPFEVEATGKGVYASKRRKPGDRFMVAKDDHFNPNWMRRLAEPKAARAKSQPAAPRTTPSGESGQEAGDNADGLT